MAITEERAGAGRSRRLMLTVVLLLAALAVAGTLTFYRYLDSTLFQERNAHFIEISDTVTQVMEAVVQNYRLLVGAAENLLLQAAELGYGACWCGCWPREERVDVIQKILGTQAVPVALIAVGAPDEEPLARGFYDPARVTWL